MKIWIMVMILFSLTFPSPLFADECMEGDCDNGMGTGFTRDNLIYQGEWQKGVPHGRGTLYVSKGRVIEGRWHNGELVEEKAAEKKNSSKKN